MNTWDRHRFCTYIYYCAPCSREIPDKALCLSRSLSLLPPPPPPHLRAMKPEFVHCSTFLLRVSEAFKLVRLLLLPLLRTRARASERERAIACVRALWSVESVHMNRMQGFFGGGGPHARLFWGAKKGARTCRLAADSGVLRCLASSGLGRE